MCVRTVSTEELEHLIRKIVREELFRTIDVSIDLNECVPISRKMERIAELSKDNRVRSPEIKKIEDEFFFKLTDMDKEIFLQYPHLRDKITVGIEINGNLEQLNITNFVAYLSRPKRILKEGIN